MYCNMHYTGDMGRRAALIIEAGGERFRFYYDLDYPDVLHITLRHGTTPALAIETFFDGDKHPWDEDRARFETLTASYGLYWTRHAHDQSVIVISCFAREEEA
jgi:hypothetical protein